MTEPVASPPAATGEEATRGPLALRAAVGVWLANAVFGLLIVAYLWFARSEVERLLVSQQHLTPADAHSSTISLLIANTVVAVVAAAGYLVFGLRLRGGSRRARTGLTALGALHVVILVFGGMSVPTFVTLLLVLAALVLTWRRSVTDWLAT